MATTKYRMIVSLPPGLEQALARLSRRDRMPRATKAVELLSHAIELEEDGYGTRSPANAI